ncbi:class I SAM-dependent methyltransferase [uncultured Pseudacidovorax sp.]|uniref:methyltransferase n=1 Tax=uncultured Pseudacidovorax sp. TaxID=679313 RepID=UPI0025EB4510|nr:class I SAM-dependent methyltransferase [uncultured Pseudacidovorax sp.]
MNTSTAATADEPPEPGHQRAYFDAIYAEQDDPYGVRTRWYERRKREMLLAALPRPRFRRAYEPGCGAAALSLSLAERCDELWCSDFHPRAVATATSLLGHLPHVRVEQRSLPQEWPQDGRFDLVVLSEVSYFLTPDDVHAMAERCNASLNADGVLVACDWRPDFAGRRCPTDEVHRLLDGLGLHRLLRHEEDDFLLQVWQRSPHSVAQAEGIR